MDENTIFGNADHANTTANTDAGTNTVTTTTPTIPAEVAELVGEGKKYKSVEDALKALPHAQKHISTLEQELKALREKEIKATTTQELLQAIQESKAIEQKATTTAQEGNPQEIQKTVQELVEQTLKAKEQETVMKTNADAVVKAFKDAYGAKAEETYKSIAEANGLSLGELNLLATKSPAAVLKLAGIGQNSSTKKSTSGGINTEALKLNNGSQAPQVKNVMYGATTSDLVAAWRAVRKAD